MTNPFTVQLVQTTVKIPLTHSGICYLQKKSILKRVVNCFFKNIKTFVKEKVLYKHGQQQCMLVDT